jgi:hypothetical protein
MEKIGRILLVGVVAGLALSIVGTVTQLVLTSFAGDAEPFFKEQGFQIILLGFFFDLVIGFLYVLAFALFRGGRPEPFWRKLVMFWLLLFLVGVVPRAADAYRYWKIPDLMALAWFASWAVEALVVSVLVALLYPKPNKAAVSAAGVGEDK